MECHKVIVWYKFITVYCTVYSFEGNKTQQAFLLSKLHYMGPSLVERPKCYLKVVKTSCIKPSTEMLLFIVYKDDDDDGNDDKNNSYTGKISQQ